MESSISGNLTMVQFIFVVIQLWIIIAPVIIIRKLNYLTDLLQAQFESNDESS